MDYGRSGLKVQSLTTTPWLLEQTTLQKRAENLAQKRDAISSNLGDAARQGDDLTVFQPEALDIGDPSAAIKADGHHLAVDLFRGLPGKGLEPAFDVVPSIIFHQSGSGWGAHDLRHGFARVASDNDICQRLVVGGIAVIAKLRSAPAKKDQCDDRSPSGDNTVNSRHIAPLPCGRAPFIRLTEGLSSVQEGLHMHNADPAPVWHDPVRVAKLPAHKPWRFALRPDHATCEAIARALDLLAVKKLTFSGEITAGKQGDWVLEGTLGATVAQPCVVTLAPVTTRIDETVTRHYTDEVPEFEPGSETEMPVDDTVEALGNTIDPGQVMVEALALALPPFPRASGAELSENTFTEPGQEPMSDADTRPFAGLKSLRDKLAGDDE